MHIKWFILDKDIFRINEELPSQLKLVETSPKITVEASEFLLLSTRFLCKYVLLELSRKVIEIKFLIKIFGKTFVPARLIAYDSKKNLDLNENYFEKCQKSCFISCLKIIDGSIKSNVL